MVVQQPAAVDLVALAVAATQVDPVDPAEQ
jgi:hypothetical protein